jgi:hypothetical protein
VLNLARLLILAGVAVAANATQISFPAGSAPDGNVGWWNAIVDNKATQLMCDDWFHRTTAPSGPDKYLVSTAQDTPNPWGNVRWNSTYFADYQVRYRAAAILIAEFLGVLSTPTGLPAAPNRSDYQWALWDMFDYNNSINGISATAAALEQKAYNLMDPTKNATYSSYASVYNRLTVYTPDPAWVASAWLNPNKLDPQEFLGFAPVPEPSQAVALFAALGLGWWMRRRKSA